MNLILSVGDERAALNKFLAEEQQTTLFWSYDVGLLAEQLRRIALEEPAQVQVLQAA